MDMCVRGGRDADAGRIEELLSRLLSIQAKAIYTHTNAQFRIQYYFQLNLADSVMMFII